MSSDAVQGPVRTCVGCRQRAAKRELLRVVASDRGSGLEVVPDPAGRAPGRGAHLHPTTDCLRLAQRRRAFVRALKVPGGIGTAALEEHLSHEGHPEKPGTDNTDVNRSTPTRNWSSSS